MVITIDENMEYTVEEQLISDFDGFCVNDAKFSPDGQFVLFSGDNGRIWIAKMGVKHRLVVTEEDEDEAMDEWESVDSDYWEDSDEEDEGMEATGTTTEFAFIWRKVLSFRKHLRFFSP